jgi:hypothetical protein
MKASFMDESHIILGNNLGLLTVYNRNTLEIKHELNKAKKVDSNSFLDLCTRFTHAPHTLRVCFCARVSSNALHSEQSERDHEGRRLSDCML